VLQISALTTISLLSHVIRVSYFASRTISDEEWNTILKKENTLLSAIIQMNESQQTHQRKERAAERIACEIKGSGMAMYRDRENFYGLLTEISRLRWGLDN
jgi:hypothetical protein